MKNSNIHIGTFGFYTKELKGAFYPINIHPKDYISFYEKHFDILELNFSKDKLITKEQAKSFIKRTKRVRFSILFTKKLFYEKNDLISFKDAIYEFFKEDRLIGVVFYIDESIKKEELLEQLNFFSKELIFVEKFIEFNKKGFKHKDFIKTVSEIGFTVVNKEAPKDNFVGPWESFGEKNYIKIYPKEKDYLYSIEELKKIKQKIRKIENKKETFIFFKGNFNGVLNAFELKSLYGFDINPPPFIKREKEREYI